MKLKTKLAAIMMAATMAFAGVGYAAWTFTAPRDAEVGTIEDKVAVGIELTDDFKLYNAANDAEVTALYLICDAPAGNANVLDGAGIYWATDAAGANAISSVYLKGSITKATEDGVLDNKATVTVQFGATDNLDTNAWVSFGNMTAPANLTNVSTANGTVVQSANFNLPAVAYVAVPTSVSELTTMNTALGTALSGAELSFTAEIIA